MNIFEKKIDFFFKSIQNVSKRILNRKSWFRKIFPLKIFFLGLNHFLTKMVKKCKFSKKNFEFFFLESHIEPILWIVYEKIDTKYTSFGQISSKMHNFRVKMVQKVEYLKNCLSGTTKTYIAVNLQQPTSLNPFSSWVPDRQFFRYSTFFTLLTLKLGISREICP